MIELRLDTLELMAFPSKRINNLHGKRIALIELLSRRDIVESRVSSVIIALNENEKIPFPAIVPSRKYNGKSSISFHGAQQEHKQQQHQI